MNNLEKLKIETSINYKKETSKKDVQKFHQNLGLQLEKNLESG